MAKVNSSKRNAPECGNAIGNPEQVQGVVEEQAESERAEFIRPARTAITYRTPRSRSLRAPRLVWVLDERLARLVGIHDYKARTLLLSDPSIHRSRSSAQRTADRPTPDTPGSGTASRSPRTSDLGGSLSLVVMHMRTRALLLTTPLPLPTPACQARRASQVPAALAGRPPEERRSLIAARRPLHAPRPRAGAHPTASTP